jgi:hypothetical protein
VESQEPFNIKFEIPKELWITSNTEHTKYKFKLFSIGKQLRQMAGWITKSYILTKSIKTPINTKLNELEWTICLPHNREFDPPNAQYITKKLLDGMVDVGLLLNDSSNEIKKTSFVRGDKTKTGKYEVYGKGIL